MALFCCFLKMEVIAPYIQHICFYSMNYSQWSRGKPNALKPEMTPKYELTGLPAETLTIVFEKDDVLSTFSAMVWTHIELFYSISPNWVN